MSRYSLDIRRKVVTAYHLGNTSIRILAHQFTMSPVTVQKYLNQYQDTQDLTPLKPGPNLGNYSLIEILSSKWWQTIPIGLFVNIVTTC